MDLLLIFSLALIIGFFFLKSQKLLSPTHGRLGVAMQKDFRLPPGAGLLIALVLSTILWIVLIEALSTLIGLLP